MSLHSLANYGILVSFIVGSIGFIGYGLGESRTGFSHPVLRRMRNLGLFASWGFILLRAFT